VEDFFLPDYPNLLVLIRHKMGNKFVPQLQISVWPKCKKKIA
jgi:hypothetical protein